MPETEDHLKKSKDLLAGIDETTGPPEREYMVQLAQAHALIAIAQQLRMDAMSK